MYFREVLREIAVPFLFICLFQNEIVTFAENTFSLK